MTEAAWDVAIDGDHVFVTGTTDLSLLGSSQRDLIVRAYDAVTGSLIWHVDRSDTSPTVIAAGNGRVFVGGFTGDGPTIAFLGAFDQANGNVLWEDAASDGWFIDIAYRDTHLVAAGSRDLRSLVRKYDSETGALEWEVAPSPPSGFDSAQAVQLSENAVYVGAVDGDDFSNRRDAVVRAYDLHNGQLIFQDRQTSKTVFDIAASGKRVLAVGSAGSPFPPTDFAVWAYHLGRDRGPSGAVNQD